MLVVCFSKLSFSIPILCCHLCYMQATGVISDGESSRVRNSLTSCKFSDPVVMQHGRV